MPDRVSRGHSRGIRKSGSPSPFLWDSRRVDASYIKSPMRDGMWGGPRVGTLEENESQEGRQVTLKPPRPWWSQNVTHPAATVRQAACGDQRRPHLWRPIMALRVPGHKGDTRLWETTAFPPSCVTRYGDCWTHSEGKKKSCCTTGNMKHPLEYSK